MRLDLRITSWDISELRSGRFSDAVFADASFIRLRNLSFSWRLPEKWKNNVHLQNGKLYMHCQNLLTITKYKGMDPETQNVFSLPPLRVLTVGVQINL